MVRAKKHPQHLAREIRSLMTGKFTAWSVYPDQIRAMIEAGAKALVKAGDSDTIEAARPIARACLAAVGIVEGGK